MNTPRIPDSEFQSRLQHTIERVRSSGLDALIVHSNEADFANVRYLSDYWPLFEAAGVAVFPDGGHALLIGPESETFAASRTKIPSVFKMVEYREPAEPDYPGIGVETFNTLFEKFGCKSPKRIGLAGWAVFPLPVYHALQKAFPGAELVKADDVLFAQRAIKSSHEIACLKSAFALVRGALDEVLGQLRPGMTELQIAGLAQSFIYANGAEYEGLPQYVLSGESSGHAIGRAGYRKIQKGDIVQLNLSARVHGYSPSIGIPVVIGTASDAQRELLEFGLKAHHFTYGLMTAGVPARDVATKFDAFVRKEGYGDYLLYGPCHGLGMIEVERPWIESTSSYDLQPGMTFQVDTYFYTPKGSRLAESHGSVFGLRWENGVRISENGPAEWLSPKHEALVEVCK
ncbi:MAG: aminopeptidase P family protein [Chthoniobacterales bacterium]|nr:aminopeptidase P family protein [Chthoniobacterales bacterium]